LRPEGHGRTPARPSTGPIEADVEIRILRRRVEQL
jgi:hypothetical protein